MKTKVEDINRNIYDIKNEDNYDFKMEKGINEEIVKEISKQKNEPEWMLEIRLKALEIYKPKIAVITNEDEYLKNNSTIYDDLKRANKDVKILLTEKHNIVIKISDNGNIVYREK